MSATKRLLSHFMNNLGKTIGSDELREIAGISEWARRIRELRNEERYRILTHNDRSDLRPGEYLMIDPKPSPAFARGISKQVRALVLERNGFTCQMCGAGAGEPHPVDLTRKTRLHLGHVVAKSEGGEDTVENLRALCSVCNEGASNVTVPPPNALKLLALIRKATKADQKVVLEFLKAKFK